MNSTPRGSNMPCAERSRYVHRQTGWVILASALLPFLFLLAIWSATPETARRLPAPLLPLLGVFALLALGFSWLTVFVTDTHVVVRFGIGLFRRSIALSDIAAVAAARSRWYEGWGVRYTRNGMLYNIGGFEAVRLDLANGRSLRIGSDDADRLRSAIARAVDAQRMRGLGR